MIEDALRKLGFGQKEIRVYAAVLKARRATPAAVAKATRISRPTVYAVAKSLATKGLLAEDLGGKTLYLVPTPPERLGRMVKEEERALKERARLIGQVQEELSRASVGAEYAVPKIRFVEEQDVEDHLYERARSWQESAARRDGIWWGFQDHSFAEAYRDWIRYVWKEVHPAGRVRLFSNRSDIEDRLRRTYAGREMKFSEKMQGFTATTWIVGDYLIMISTARHPFSLVEIHDELLAQNLREVFRSLWELV